MTSTAPATPRTVADARAGRPGDPAAHRMADALRALSVDAIEHAGSGHPGLPLGMADAVTALVADHLTFDPDDPQWPDRDRLVLSAGHGSMLLYAALHLTGYDVGVDDLRSFRQLGSKTAGHPEYGHCPGVETTTGPLAQGLATAVGMALAERMLNARHGDDLVDHRTYVIAGDGCLMEGLSQEAVDLAGHLGLDRLTVLFDDNGITIDGGTELATGTDQVARFAAAGWHTLAVDGHDAAAVSQALAQARTAGRPTLISCRTTIGYGAPTKQGTSASHGSPLGAAEVAATKAALGWEHGPFEVPADVRDAWRATADRGREARRRWQHRLDRAPGDVGAQLRRPVLLAGRTEAALDDLVRDLAAEQPQVATRVASKRVLDALVPVEPTLLGGSADLGGSTGARTAHHRDVTAGDPGGNYVNYGVREHGMGAVLNGLALHGGFRPYGSTFLAFADYSRPAVRLAALMALPVVHVFTHDSIGLGEDGPTHQPVEQLASLRAVPNLTVLRPADAVETAQAWGVALRSRHTPTALVLSRQPVRALPRRPPAAGRAAGGVTDGVPDGVARGGWVVLEPAPRRDVTLVGTGSEVGVALDAARRLGAEGIAAAVVSLPSFELFAGQPAGYREQVLGDAPRVAVEAAVRQGWDAWLRPGDAFVGMSGFGASGRAGDLYEHFGLTADAVASAARRLLAGRSAGSATTGEQR